MDPISIVKTVTQIAVSIGTSAVVTNAIKATTPATLSRGSKIAVAIGSVAVSSMIGDKVGKYVVEQIDDLRNQFKKTQIETPEDSNE